MFVPLQAGYLLLGRCSLLDTHSKSATGCAANSAQARGCVRWSAFYLKQSFELLPQERCVFCMILPICLHSQVSFLRCDEYLTVSNKIGACLHTCNCCSVCIAAEGMAAEFPCRKICSRLRLCYGQARGTRTPTLNLHH